MELLLDSYLISEGFFVTEGMVLVIGKPSACCISMKFVELLGDWLGRAPRRKSKESLNLGSLGCYCYIYCYIYCASAKSESMEVRDLFLVVGPTCGSTVLNKELVESLTRLLARLMRLSGLRKRLLGPISDYMLCYFMISRENGIRAVSEEPCYKDGGLTLCGIRNSARHMSSLGAPWLGASSRKSLSTVAKQPERVSYSGSSAFWASSMAAYPENILELVGLVAALLMLVWGRSPARLINWAGYNFNLPADSFDSVLPVESTLYIYIWAR